MQFTLHRDENKFLREQKVECKNEITFFFEFETLLLRMYCNFEVGSIFALGSCLYDKTTYNCNAKRKYENEENNK